MFLLSARRKVHTFTLLPICWNEKLNLSDARHFQCEHCKFEIHRDWNGARNNGLCMCTAGGYYRTFVGNNENGKIAKSKKFLFTQSLHEVEE